MAVRGMRGSLPILVGAVAGILMIGGCSGEPGGTNPPPDGTPASIAIVSGDNQAGTAGAALAAPLVVMVRDGDGDLLPDVTVNWTIQTGGGSLGASSTTTDTDGRSQTTYTLGPGGGTYTVRAAVAGSASLTATFTATAPIADPVPASIEVAGGDNQSAGLNQALAGPLTVRVRNAAGILLPGVSVTWAVTSGGGTVGFNTSTTSAAGIASNTFTTGGTAGASTITAAITSNTALSVAFTATTAAVVNGAVTVGDNFFDPTSVSVSVGGQVTWTWGGTFSHNVTWVAGGFTNSGTQATGTHAVTFGGAGTFQYYCTIHGTPTTGMRGSVTVQ